MMFKTILLWLSIIVLLNSGYLCHSYQLKRFPNIIKSSTDQANLLKHFSPSHKSQYSQTTPTFESKSRVVLNSIQTNDLELDESYQKEVVNTLGLIAAAGGFAGLLGVFKGEAASLEFVSGYLLELCLSVDNLIVFILLFDSFKVEKKSQDKILAYGILGAIVLRGIFIAAGGAAIQSFSQVLGVFALILAYSSFKILFPGEDEEDDDIANQPVVKFAKKYLPTTDKMDGDK